MKLYLWARNTRKGMDFTEIRHSHEYEDMISKPSNHAGKSIHTLISRVAGINCLLNFPLGLREWVPLLQTCSPFYMIYPLLRFTVFEHIYNSRTNFPVSSFNWASRWAYINCRLTWIAEILNFFSQISFLLQLKFGGFLCFIENVCNALNWVWGCGRVIVGSQIIKQIMYSLIALAWFCGRSVGIELPTIEVRYENLSVDADCYVGSRALPSLWNAARNFVEVTQSLQFSKQLILIMSRFWMWREFPYSVNFDLFWRNFTWLRDDEVKEKLYL